MAISISGSNAISGLSGSDTDFDKVLAQLKKVESTQLNNLEAWKSDWSLRYQAFGKVIEQVSAASNVLSNLANKNSFVTKNVTSSDSNVITAVASAAADDVQHTINVTQVASNAIWANGHVFSSKTDIINTSGATQQFSYRYAGKDYSIDVPANTTLDSFVSMVNNSVSNPGIKISLVQANSGYVFQVAGKSTGADNDLVVYSSDLVGMNSTGATSTWSTNNVLDMSSTVSDPTNYAYDLLMEDGNTFSVSIKGNKTNSDLAAAINSQVGRNIASINTSTGELELTDVKAMYRRDADTQSTFSTPTTKFSVGTSPDTTTLSGDLTVTLSMNDGVTSGTRTLTIAAGTTMKDAALQIAQASGATSAEMTYNSSGGWDMSLSNVEGATFSFADSAGDTSKISATVTTTASALGAKVLGTNDTGAQSVSLSTGLTFDSAKLGDALGGSSADASKSFTYTIVDSSGGTQSFSLAQTATYQDLQNALVAHGGTLSGGTVTFANTESVYLSGGGTGGGMDGVTAKTDAVTTITQMAAADTLENPPALEYSYAVNGGSTATFSLAGNSSMADVIAQIKAQGLSGSLVSADGTTTIDLQTGTLPTTGSYYLKLNNVDTFSGPDIAGQVTSSSNWSIRSAANAKYTVDNWPVEMESDSNTVSSTLEGVVFTIQGTGSSTLAVNTDITSVEKSIQSFLDAVNSVLLTINDYTNFDADKEVTTNDPDKSSSDNYSASVLTAEKGGLLQGNYGVQLFKSRFTTLLNNAPPGFTSRTDAENLLSGDVLANLANMGIKVETDKTSSNYGLLVIAPSSGIAELQQMDQSNYEDMINNHLNDVVDFFCSSGTGTSTSSDFRYGSHISGITKGGTYDVNYTVDAAGNITNVTVGGVEASRDTSQPGYYYSVGSGDARGLSLQIDNLSEGDHSGQIRIKEGLVQTVSSFLTSELTFTDVNVTATGTAEQNASAIALKSQNGALMVLQDNYQTIMENIDKKITQEQERLDQWETRQKTYFANLETLLKQYNTQKTQLDSQLKSLSSSSSSS